MQDVGIGAGDQLHDRSRENRVVDHIAHLASEVEEGQGPGTFQVSFRRASCDRRYLGAVGVRASHHDTHGSEPGISHDGPASLQ